MSKNILITGGAGFIGSALVRYLINETDNTVINYDKLTYAGNLESLSEIENSDRYHFVHADICDRDKVSETLESFNIDLVMHLLFCLFLVLLLSHEYAYVISPSR